MVFPPEKGSKEMKENILKKMVLKYPPKKYELGDEPFMLDKQYMYRGYI